MLSSFGKTTFFGAQVVCSLVKIEYNCSKILLNTKQFFCFGVLSLLACNESLCEERFHFV